MDIISPQKPNVSRFLVRRFVARSVKNLFVWFLGVGLLLPTLITVSAFEAHIVNVTATIENQPCSALVNFEYDANGSPIAPGQFIDNEYAPWGLTIFVKQTSSIEPDPNHPSITFNSSSPTGGQFDLGTPNEDFGGPGIGEGGRAGMPGQNDRIQRNILVAADSIADENSDGFVDVPRSHDDLSKLMFVFSQPTAIYSLRLFDVDEEDVVVRLFDESRNNFATVNVPVLGDNSAQTIDLTPYLPGSTTPPVKAMKVAFRGTGGVDDVCFDRVNPDAVQQDHIVINEVYYDTGNRGQGNNREREGDNEWIELYNPTPNPVNLKNWKVTDNSGTLRTISTSNRTLFPGQFAVLSKAANTFTFWDIPSSALQIQLGENIGNGLANDGDRVLLFNDLGNLIDAMSYGSDVSELNPSVPDVPEGHSVARRIAGFDTDSATDWEELGVPNPGTNPHSGSHYQGGFFAADEEAEPASLIGGEGVTEDSFNLEPSPVTEEPVVPEVEASEADNNEVVPEETPPAEIEQEEVSGEQGEAVDQTPPPAEEESSVPSGENSNDGAVQEEHESLPDGSSENAPQESSSENGQ